jgi:hypothetical protein
VHRARVHRAIFCFGISGRIGARLAAEVASDVGARTDSLQSVYAACDVTSFPCSPIADLAIPRAVKHVARFCFKAIVTHLPTSFSWDVNLAAPLATAGVTAFGTSGPALPVVHHTINIAHHILVARLCLYKVTTRSATRASFLRAILDALALATAAVCVAAPPVFPRELAVLRARVVFTAHNRVNPIGVALFTAMVSFGLHVAANRLHANAA